MCSQSRALPGSCEIGAIWLNSYPKTAAEKSACPESDAVFRPNKTLIHDGHTCAYHTIPATPHHSALRRGWGVGSVRAPVEGHRMGAWERALRHIFH